MIPTYGLNGAAMATALTMILVNLLIQGFIYWHFRLHPFSIKMVWVVLAGGVTYFFNTLLPHSFGYWAIDLLVRSLLLAACYLSLIFAFRLVPDLNDFIRKYFFNR